MCLHKQDDGWGDGNNIHLWDCSEGPSENKTWHYDARTGYIRAKSNPAMCLHKQDDGWENGNNIHLWPCNQGPEENKSWDINPPRSTFHIVPAYNQSKCLHKQDAGWGDGNNIHLWDRFKGPPENQTWIYFPEKGLIQAAWNPSMCLHKQDYGWGDGNNIHLWDCFLGPPENKTWIYDLKNRYIRAKSNPSMCLHKQDMGFGNGNNIHLWECNKGPDENKQWDIELADTERNKGPERRDSYEAELELTSLIINDDFDGFWANNTGEFTIFVYHEDGLLGQIFDTTRSFGTGNHSIDPGEGSFIINSHSRYFDLTIHLREKDSGGWDDEANSIRHITLDLLNEKYGNVRCAGNNKVLYHIIPVIPEVYCEANVITDTIIYTPKGKPVEAEIRQEYSRDCVKEFEKSTKELIKKHGWSAEIREDSSSATYNCHGYAWHVVQGGERVFIKGAEIQKYLEDGSYTEIEEYEATWGDIIYYRGDETPLGPADHSVVIMNKTDQGLWCISKWHMGPLVEHSCKDCPYYKEGYIVKYYRRNID